MTQRRDRRESERARDLEAWVPVTRLGMLVKSGEIKTLGDALRSNYPVKEYQVVDALLPELSEEVLDINLVQRMTDSGRRVKFRVCVIVGNRDGYIGIGLGKDALVRSGIEKAVRDAKMNMTHIKRGCGSWECNCGGTHSIPFKVVGKAGSVEITLKPAPKGIGLATGNIPKRVLDFSGVKDVWAQTKGQTRTTFNQAFATFEALRKIALVKTLE
ncbi:MAG: 30S ribosomal protein S5 [Methanosarcinales archaeon]|nr:30S ribosomal protein S5 [Methanosarcinales archaeon]